MTVKYQSYKQSANGNVIVLAAGDVGLGLSNDGKPRAEGVVHSIAIAPDATGGTLALYDGNVASGRLFFKLALPANAPQFGALLDAQITVGLAVSLSGFASPNFSVTYR